MMEMGTATAKKIRVGLLGAGKMALHHAKAIHMREDARLVAVADPAISSRECFMEIEQDVEICSGAEELFDHIKPDVVHICTPPETHVPLARLALQRGSHVYVEKPFAPSKREAVELIALAKDNGLGVCAGHQLLFEFPALKAEEHLRKLGRLVHIESYFSFKPVRHSKDGRTAISPLEQLVDILPHPVYLLLHFLKKNSTKDGDPVEIRALEARASGSVHGILRRGETTGNLIVTLEGRPIESYIKIIGTNGCMFADFVRGSVIVLPGPGVSSISKILNPYRQSWQMFSGTTRALFRRVSRKQKSYPGLFEIIGNFYERLRSGQHDSADYSSIIETVAICEEIGKKLEIAEREENSLLEKDHDRLESMLFPPDRSRGGVLVTGGTGFLGKAVASELRKSHWLTRVVARKIPLVANRIPGVEYAAADLAENISPEIFRDISIVVHCAAETGGGKEAHKRNSVGATRNLIEAMNRTGVKKLIHISSIAVLKTSREIGIPVDENAPLVNEDDDRGPYVCGKAMSERLAKDMGTRLGIEIHVIRPGPLVDYNAFEAPGRLGREVGPLFIYFGNGKSKMSICNVQTAAKVIRKYVEDFDSMPPVLNLIEPNAPTRAELVSILLNERPDLRAFPFPFFILRVLSPGLKLLQRVLRPGQKPLDIYAAFASERYKSDLAAEIIERPT